MRIAYLITAYKDLKHLKKLIDALDGQNVFFYVHLDLKSSETIDFAMENLILIDRIKVWWGGWSHLQAILNLINASLTRKHDYYILISGADYPIRSNKFLVKLLNDGGQYINILKGFHSSKPESRIKYYYFDCFDRRNLNSYKTKIFLLAERILRRLLKKREYPFIDIYHGTTWWALNYDCVKYIQNYIDVNPGFIRFFKTSWCPEESFIPTIIGNSKFLSECKTNLTFQDWSTDPAPAYITKAHIDLLRYKFTYNGIYGKNSPFFARKFSNKSYKLLNIIDSDLRSE